MHLLVVAGETGVHIDPILGEDGSYSTCLDLWERDTDLCWPALVTQMHTLPMLEVEYLVLHEAATSTTWVVIDTLVAQVTGIDRTGDETKPGGVTSGDSAAWRSTHSVEITGQGPRGCHRTWEYHPECLYSQL